MFSCSHRYPDVFEILPVDALHIIVVNMVIFKLVEYVFRKFGLVTEPTDEPKFDSSFSPPFFLPLILLVLTDYSLVVGRSLGL